MEITIKIKILEEISEEELEELKFAIAVQCEDFTHKIEFDGIEGNVTLGREE